MTIDTTTHYSTICTAGPNGGKCEMCRWADSIKRPDCPVCLQPHHGYDAEGYAIDCPNGVALDGLTIIEQSAAAVRARRAALLERADAESPTEGAIALAEAWLSDEAWYRHLPNNALQDAAVLELAGEIESAIDSYLQGQREE